MRPTRKFIVRITLSVLLCDGVAWFVMVDIGVARNTSTAPTGVPEDKEKWMESYQRLAQQCANHRQLVDACQICQIQNDFTGEQLLRRFV